MSINDWWLNWKHLYIADNDLMLGICLWWRLYGLFGKKRMLEFLPLPISLTILFSTLLSIYLFFGQSLDLPLKCKISSDWISSCCEEFLLSSSRESRLTHYVPPHSVGQIIHTFVRGRTRSVICPGVWSDSTATR